MVTKETTPKPGSLKHAAARIGCSLPTLYDLIEARKLRSYHIGRAHRVSEQAIADCIVLLERENQECAAGETFPRTRFLGATAANDGNLRTALTNVASDKCA
jgi:excisionase family DNA binding protein